MFEQHLLLPNIILKNMVRKILISINEVQCDQKNTNHRPTLAATMFDVRTSFPFVRSWYVSPCLPPAIVA